MFIKASHSVISHLAPQDKHGTKKTNESQSPPSPRYSANTFLLILSAHTTSYTLTHIQYRLKHVYTSKHPCAYKQTDMMRQRLPRSVKYILAGMHSCIPTYTHMHTLINEHQYLFSFRLLHPHPHTHPKHTAVWM